MMTVDGGFLFDCHITHTHTHTHAHAQAHAQAHAHARTHTHTHTHTHSHQGCSVVYRRHRVKVLYLCVFATLSTIILTWMSFIAITVICDFLMFDFLMFYPFMDRLSTTYTYSCSLETPVRFLRVSQIEPVRPVCFPVSFFLHTFFQVIPVFFAEISPSCERKRGEREKM